MSDQQAIVTEMISFIEAKEKELQQNKLLSDQQAKNDTIKAILKKLEAETDEDK